MPLPITANVKFVTWQQEYLKHLEQTFGDKRFDDYELMYLSDQGMILYDPSTDIIAQCSRPWSTKIESNLSNLCQFVQDAIVYHRNVTHKFMCLIKDKDKELPYILMVFHNSLDVRNTVRKLIESRMKYLGISIKTHDTIRSPNFSYDYSEFTEGLATLWLSFESATDYAMFIFHFHQMIVPEDEK